MHCVYFVLGHRSVLRFLFGCYLLIVFWCCVAVCVVYLFLMVPSVGLWSMIGTFRGHYSLVVFVLFCLKSRCLRYKTHIRASQTKY